MMERGYTKGEVEQVVANPSRGRWAPPARDVIEHFGYASNARLLNVVTNRDETLVISVIDQ